MLITTKNLVLRPLEPSHIEAFNESSSALACALNVAVPGSWPWEETCNLLPKEAEAFKEDPSQIGWWTWLILHRASHTLIGDVNLGGKPDDRGVVSLAYSIVPEYRVRGYGFEAAKLMVDYALEQEGVKAVQAKTRTGHLPSQRILEKLGFEMDSEGDGQIIWRLDKAAVARN